MPPGPGAWGLIWSPDSAVTDGTSCRRLGGEPLGHGMGLRGAPPRQAAVSALLSRWKVSGGTLAAKRSSCPFRGQCRRLLSPTAVQFWRYARNAAKRINRSCGGLLFTAGRTGRAPVVKYRHGTCAPRGTGACAAGCRSRLGPHQSRC